MRLTTIIILAACLQSSANGLAQNTVTFSGKDVNLESVFTAIKKQTSYRFFFNTSIIQNASKVTIEVKNAPIEQVLNLALKDQSLTFAIKGRTIFVMKKPEEDKSSQVAPVTGDPVTVSGRVFDENGAPAQGVNITVRGTNKGTTTNLKGEFEISGINEGAVLLISSVGYDRQEVIVKSKNFITTQLKVAVGNLDELQVIAYGTTSKRLNTGNVTTIKASDIEKQPINNPLLALQGRVAGLVVSQVSGFAGSGVSVQIQGQNSIGVNIGSDPLYIVDGVPYPGRSLNTLSILQGYPAGGAPAQAGLQPGTGSPLSFINPADIESIDVLKDADATAIYGSRAANGAIIITTKKGKAGQTKVSLNLQSGIGKVGHFFDVLNRSQYLEMRNEAFKNDGKIPAATDYDMNGTWDTTRSTNWQKVLIGGSAKYTDLQANVSGGTANTQFLIGAGYHKETTVFPGNLADQRGSFHFNVNNVSPNQKFRLQWSGNYMADNNRLINRDLTQDAVALSPVAPDLYNYDGTLNWAPLANGTSTWINPLAYLNNEYSNKTENLISNAEISYQILKGLDLKSSFGYNNLRTDQYVIFPLLSVLPENRATTLRSSQFSNSRINSWIVEPNLSYKFLFGKFGGNSLLGVTFLENSNDYKSQTGSGYSSDIFIKDISSAPTKTANSGYSQYKYNAVFGRITLNWDEKYIINLTARRDGSSRFGEKNQFHNFGSLASAWIFSKELFVMNNLPFLSFGKLRISYGSTGNDQIGEYRFLNLYNSITGVGVAYQNAVGLSPNGLPNPYLQWEETKKLQLGVDLGFLSDRITLNANYYQNRSSNELLNYNLPIISGFSSITRNFPATIQNYGWEFSLSSKNVKSSKFNWSSNLNLTIPKNKLLSFPDIETSTYASTYIIGKPVTITKAYHLVGEDQTTGVYVFEKADGSLTSTPNSVTDRPIIINTAPRFYGGLQNTFSYKDFQVDILFQFVKQIGRNTTSMGTGRVGQFFGTSNLGNQSVAVLNRWQKTGDDASSQRFYAYSNTNYFLAGFTATQSDKAYSDASYIRMKNVSISWGVPEKWRQKIKLQNARIYVQGQNLLTITNYKGMDPETRSSTTLPPLRIITAGLQISL